MTTKPYRTRWCLAIFGLLILSLSACNTKATTNSVNINQLSPSKWLLAKQPASPSDRPLTLNFENGRVSGFNGCNSYSGSYVANPDGTLAFGRPGVTRILCQGQAQQIEANYMNQLAQVRIYALTRGQLQLLDANRKLLLTFQASI